VSGNRKTCRLSRRTGGEVDQAAFLEKKDQMLLSAVMPAPR
jgi:hypothetical protein